MAVYYVTPFKWPSFEYKLWLETLKAAPFQEAANWGCLPRVYSASRFLSITTQAKLFFGGFSSPLKLLETRLKDPRGSDPEPKWDRATTLCSTPGATGIALSVLSGNTRHRHWDPFARTSLAWMMDEDYSANNQVPSPREERRWVRSQPAPVKTPYFIYFFF